MAKDLLEASKTSRPESMVRVYEALKVIAGYAVAPLVTKLIPASPSVEELASGNVKLQVRGRYRVLKLWFCSQLREIDVSIPSPLPFPPTFTY